MTTHFSGPIESTNGFVGDLTGNVVGNLTGNVIGNITGKTAFPSAVVPAAGSGQSTYAALSSQINAVTGANGTLGVALPAAVAGEAVFIYNTSQSQSLPVAPVNGGNDQINSLTAGTGVFTMGPGRAAWFTPTSATQWYVSGDAAIVGTPTEQDMDGLTATTAELNKVDADTAGGLNQTGTACTLHNHTLAVGATDVTATYTELNYLDLAALGTGAASKAVVLDANGDYIFPNTSTIQFAGAGVVSALRIGNWKAGQAAGNAIVFTAGMDSFTASDGQLDVMAAFGESVADLTSAYSAKVGRFRHLITFGSDTVINQETYGLVGQLVIKNASLNHYHGGLMGTFETTTDCDIQTSYGAAGVISRLGGAGTTIESGGLLAGFLSIQHMSAFTATGTMAAFATHKTSTGIAWPIGLYMQTGSVDKAGVLNAGSDGLYVNVAALTSGDAYSGIRSVVAAADPSNSYGTAGYFETTLTGSQAGNFVYGLGSWLNMSAGTQGLYVCAQDNGVWEGTGANVSSSRVIFGMRMEAIMDDQPARLCPFSINPGSNLVLSALFSVEDTPQLGVTDTKTTTSTYLPLFITDDGNVRYVELFS